jgi:hypothetical protein
MGRRAGRKKLQEGGMLVALSSVVAVRELHAPACQIGLLEALCRLLGKRARKLARRSGGMSIMLTSHAA